MLNFAVVGSGQAGGKLADVFARSVPAVAVNTAPQDLDSLKNIKTDYRIHTKINESGGAGKDIRLGEIAVQRFENEIMDVFRLAFEGVEYVFVTVGLGGGTGTLGSIQISRILSKMGMKHGFIATLPTVAEGTYEQINAVTGLYMLEEARKKFTKNLRTIILVDNEKLKNYILASQNVSYEKTWDEANNYIYRSFMDLYELSQTAGESNFDTTDYKKLFDLPGYMAFGRGVIDQLDQKSDNVLAKEVKNFWSNSIFPGSENVQDARGVAVVVNRPAGYDTDGLKINQLFNEVKSYFGAVHFCSGVYSTESKIGKLAEKVSKKPVEIFTLLAGMPMPAGRIKELYEMATKEQTGLKSKEKNTEFKFDRKIIEAIIDPEPEPEIEDDFSFFKGKIEKTALDWSKLK